MADFALSFSRGDTVFLDVTVTLSGVAQNIAGWSLWFTAKRRKDDADAAAVCLKTLGDGITTVDAAAGTVFVTLDPADTAGLPASQTVLVADLQGKDSSGHIYTLASGTLTVTGDVTQETS